MIIINDKVSAEITEWIEPIKGLKLLICSGSEKHRNALATIHRHIDRVDSRLGAGTDNFSVAGLDAVGSMDDLQVEAMAQYLIKDWKGVGELNEDGKEVAVEYTSERGVALIKQNLELYWKVMVESARIAKEENKQVDETVKKSSKRKVG